MLGEQIGEEKGKVTARRVPSIDGGTKVEVSFQSSGKLLGVEHQRPSAYLWQTSCRVIPLAEAVTSLQQVRVDRT